MTNLMMMIQIIEHLKRTSMNLEGIFRESGPSLEIKSVKEKLENSEAVNFYELSSPHTIGSVLKKVLRELPETLLTDRVCDILECLLIHVAL